MDLTDITETYNSWNWQMKTRKLEIEIGKIAYNIVNQHDISLETILCYQALYHEQAPSTEDRKQGEGTKGRRCVLQTSTFDLANQGWSILPATSLSDPGVW